MLFSSVFNSAKGSCYDDEEEETSDIMKLNSKNENNSSRLDNDENRYLIDTPKHTNGSYRYKSNYIDDGDYYSPNYSSKNNENIDFLRNENEIDVGDTLQKIRNDYEKSKIQLQNSSVKSNFNFSYKSIFGNGDDSAEDDEDRLLKLRLKSKKRDSKLKTNITDKYVSGDELRDDSLYSFDLAKQDLKSKRFYNQETSNLDYSPISYRKTNRELELENLDLKYRLKLDKLAQRNDSKVLLETRSYDSVNNNANYDFAKLEKERLNEKINQYSDSIQKQDFHIQKHENIISNLEQKYLSLHLLLEDQKEEMQKLRNGLANERESSIKLKNRVELLNERLSDTKNLLYKEQLQKRASNYNKVRFDDLDSISDKKGYHLRSPSSTPPLIKMAETRTSSYENDDEEFSFNCKGLDMDNTQHVLKMASKY
ncbi:hypothetical protein QEN19_001484 [Hanseniaspora menglaensis]